MIGWAHFERAVPALSRHAHAELYEICFIVRGSVEWWAQSQIFQVEPFDVFLTRPDEEHGGVDAIMHPCELLWVLVRPNDQMLKELLRLRLRHFKGDARILRHMERLLAEHRQRDAQSAAAVRATLHLLVIDTLRLHDAAEREGQKAHSPSPPIFAAMEAMCAHLG